jgi:hypothetical protein
MFSQGPVQVLEAAVTGLTPKQPYVLALSTKKPDGTGPLQPLTPSMTNAKRAFQVTHAFPGGPDTVRSSHRDRGALWAATQNVPSVSSNVGRAIVLCRSLLVTCNSSSATVCEAQPLCRSAFQPRAASSAGSGLPAQSRVGGE